MFFFVSIQGMGMGLHSYHDSIINHVIGTAFAFQQTFMIFFPLLFQWIGFRYTLFKI